MRAALFITCLGDTLFPEAGRATVRILKRLGVEVEFPVEQTCCGQMHFNTGYGHDVLPLVRRFADTFRGAEAIVTPSGSCAAMVLEHYPRLARAAGEDRLAEGSTRWPGGCTSSHGSWSTCSAWRTSARASRAGSPTTLPATPPG